MTDAVLFSAEGYATLLAAFAARGYEVRGYTEVEPEKAHLVLRHDVDISLAQAAGMAGLEKSLGVQSSYFILLRTEFYNPLSAAGLAAIQQIRACGHEIGLHFDASLYSEDDTDLEAGVRRECEILESAIDAPVRLISFHRPAEAQIGSVGEIGGRVNVYAARFVSEMGYVSDSRGSWQHGLPLDHPAVQEGHAVQLLTHPIWWMGEGGAPTLQLKRFLSERGRFLDQELARQCTIHVPGRWGGAE